MEASAIEALVTASRQSAEMAQEAIRTLKEMKEKHLRKEGGGFATASKVVKAPEAFSPANLEEELSQWQDWKLSFKSWLCFAEQAYEKEVEAVEGSETATSMAVMSEEKV